MQAPATPGVGVRVATVVVGVLGSWRFIGTQSAAIAVWLVGNGAYGWGFDPFPFILLNLCLSLQAAYAAPLILMAEHHQSARMAYLQEATYACDCEHTQQLRHVHDRLVRIELHLRRIRAIAPKEDR